MNEIEELIKEGRKRHDREEFDDAIAFFDKGLAIDSKSAELWFNKGRSIQSKGQSDQALECYEKAIGLKSDYKEAWNNKGNILDHKKEVEKALECYETTIRIDVNYWKGWYNKGFVYLEKKEYGEAEKCFDKLISLKSNYPASYVSKGLFYGNQKIYEKALDYFHKALDIDENDLDALYFIGSIFYVQKKFLKAIEYYNKFLRIKQTSIVLLYKGMACEELNYLDVALRCYEQALEIDPKDVRTIYNIGRIYYGQKKYGDSIKRFDEIIKLAPNNREAYLGKGFALTELKRYHEAITPLRKAKELKDEHHVQNSLSWVLSLDGKNEEALQLIENALKEKPEQSAYVDTKGYILYNMEDYDHALELLNKAIGLNPDDAVYWYHKGLVQIKKEKFRDAIRCLNEATKLDPDLAEAYNAKAKSLLENDQLEEAIDSLKTAISIDPQYSEAHENLVKATRSTTKIQEGFWDFWSSSTTRKITAIILCLFTVSLAAYPIISGYETVSIVNEGGKITRTSELAVPTSYMIIIGFILFILMSPIIRKAKVGPVEFELGDSPTPTSYMSSSGGTMIFVKSFLQ